MQLSWNENFIVIIVQKHILKLNLIVKACGRLINFIVIIVQEHILKLNLIVKAEMPF